MVKRIFPLVLAGLLFTMIAPKPANAATTAAKVAGNAQTVNYLAVGQHVTSVTVACNPARVIINGQTTPLPGVPNIAHVDDQLTRLRTQGMSYYVAFTGRVVIDSSCPKAPAPTAAPANKPVTVATSAPAQNNNSAAPTTACKAVEDDSAPDLSHQTASAAIAWFPAHPEWERHVQFWTNVKDNHLSGLVWVKMAPGDNRGLIGSGKSWAFPPNCGADQDWAKNTTNGTVKTMDDLAQMGLVVQGQQTSSAQTAPQPPATAAPAQQSAPPSNNTAPLSCNAVEDQGPDLSNQTASAAIAWHPKGTNLERHTQFWTNAPGQDQKLVWVKIAPGDTRGLIGSGHSWGFAPNCGGDADWSKIVASGATIVTMDDLAARGLVVN